MDIVCIDIETTGLDKHKDHIIQLGMIKFDQETNEIIDSFNTYIKPIGNYNISIAAWMKHHIVPDMLKNAPTLKDIGQKFLDFINGCALLTYNGISFDLPFLSEEFASCGIIFNPTIYTIYDSFKIEQEVNPVNLEGTYKRYTGKTYDNSHDAYADVMATIEVFNFQTKNGNMHPSEMITCDNMLAYKDFGENKVLCFTQGKYKDVPVITIKKFDSGYIDWVLSNKFSKKTKELIRNIQ